MNNEQLLPFSNLALQANRLLAYKIVSDLSAEKRDALEGALTGGATLQICFNVIAPGHEQIELLCQEREGARRSIVKIDSLHLQSQ